MGPATGCIAGVRRPTDITVVVQLSDQVLGARHGALEHDHQAGSQLHRDSTLLVHATPAVPRCCAELRFDTSAVSLQAAYSISPGTTLSLQSTNEPLHLTLAYAAVNAAIESYLEWQVRHTTCALEAWFGMGRWAALSLSN